MAATADRWLVAGLGNPEDTYAGTRHNVGADVVGVLARRAGASLSRDRRLRCATAEVRLAGVPVTLLRPLGYMNESGGPVSAAVRWYGTDPARLVVIHDDIDLELGVLRLRFDGGDAGHLGVRDVTRALGTPDFHRVRIGVGRPPGRMDAADYVLRRFTPAEREVIDVTIEEAADAVGVLVSEGLEAAQSRYHARR